jgi:uncharacterized protein YceH (UPF0502 family)
LATGRLLPGEPTAAAEPLRGLSSNEALLIQQVETRRAGTRRLVNTLPRIIQRSLQALVRKIDRAWEKDGEVYDRLFSAPVRAASKPKRTKRAGKAKPAARKAKPKKKKATGRTKAKKARTTNS